MILLTVEYLTCVRKEFEMERCYLDKLVLDMICINFNTKIMSWLVVLYVAINDCNIIIEVLYNI
jgi:hypothetical protein